MTERRARRGRAAHAGGMAAEAIASAALVADGWTVLRRRARTAAGEVDIVARRADVVAFVEVKARATLTEAAFALGERQQRRLQLAAAVLLAEHPDWASGDIRFDVMVVDRAGRVRRIADAFRGDGDCS